MGIFDLLFGNSTGQKQQHPFWGEMFFYEGRKLSEGGYYECNCQFLPVGKVLEVFVHTGKTGLTDLQVDFYKNIEENYPAIVTGVIPVLEDEFSNWQDGFKIKDFAKEFDVVSISIPDCQSHPIEWEIAYESIHDENHTFTLTMHNFVAQHVNIDG